MIVNLNDFKTGWYGLTLGLTESEICDLITRLEDLRSKKLDHFHYRSDFDETAKLGDIEFFLADPSEQDKHNLKLE